MRAPSLLPSLLPLALLAQACTPGPYMAPYGSSVTLGESTLSSTAGTYCGDTEPDYTGGLMMIDAMAVDGTTSLPLENVQVEVEVNALAGVYVLPQEAVKTVDFPAADTDITSQSDVKAACVDENGNFDNTNEWCSWYWDEDSAQFYQFGEDYADAGGYAPTYFLTATDHRGLVRIFMFMDCIYGDSTMEVSIGVDNDTFTISTS